MSIVTITQGMWRPADDGRHTYTVPVMVALDGRDLFVINCGFTTDFASINCPLIGANEDPRWKAQGGMHDYCYSHHALIDALATAKEFRDGRQFADWLFRVSLKGRTRWRWVFWAWLRMFGKKRWDKYKPKGAQ
jgi:hypothetical protein